VERRQRAVQVIATAVTAMLAGLIVIGVTSSPPGRGEGVAQTRPSPTVAGAHDYGPPPAGVNLLWVYDPVDVTRLIGYDWSGKPRASLKPANPAGLTMAPDGQSFVIGLRDYGDWHFFNRLGQPLLVPNMAGQFPSGTMWADDSRHVCAFTFDPTTLWIMEVGSSPTRVGERPGATYLAACSVLADRVVAVRIGGDGSPTGVWVVHASDGKVVSERTYAPGALWGVIASSDGQYVAETATGGRSTQIRRVSDWSVLATLAGEQVLAFSGDGTRVMAGQIDSRGGATGLVDVEWATGRIVWASAAAVLLPDLALIPEPQSQSFVIGIPVSLGTAEPRDLTIVEGDGTAVELGRYQLAFSRF
jgi:hypothetical protein